MTREQARNIIDFDKVFMDCGFKEACEKKDVDLILEHCAARLASEVNEALQWGWCAGNNGKGAPVPPGDGEEWDGLGEDE